MVELDHACEVLVHEVEGAFACGFVDVVTQRPLAAHTGPSGASTLDLEHAPELLMARTPLCAATATAPTRLEPRRLHIVTGSGLRLYRTIGVGPLAVVLLARAGTAIDRAWASLEYALQRLELERPAEDVAG